MEYFLQKGLPEYIKAEAMKLGDSSSYAWPTSSIKEVIDWIEINNSILLSIYVFTLTTGHLKYNNLQWAYKGDRTKNREENIDTNLASARIFINNLNNQSKCYYFDILFQREQNMEELDQEFLDKAIIHGGDITYSEQDALDIIDRCRKKDLKITNIDAYLIEDDFIQPTDYRPYIGSAYDNYNPEKYYQRNGVHKNADIGHWQEAKRWISDRANQGWTFEINYKKFS